jgi:hypothetical protein
MQGIEKVVEGSAKGRKRLAATLKTLESMRQRKLEKKAESRG